MKRLKITVDGTPYDVTVEEIEDETLVSAPSQAAAAVQAPETQPIIPPAKPTQKPAAHSGSGVLGEVISPLAGKVLKIDVTVNQQVEAGQSVLHLEAMKMESELVAPISGTVKSINVAEGVNVQEGELLLTIG
jgi:glutaconyl-CoA/methylmalonyl-CoA decarboxylase subunit gamma